MFAFPLRRGLAFVYHSYRPGANTTAEPARRSELAPFVNNNTHTHPEALKKKGTEVAQ